MITFSGRTMIYILAGFIFGGLVPYMSRRFAKFMPATPAYALYRLVKPVKTARKKNEKYRRLARAYVLRSLVYAGIGAALALWRFGDGNLWWWLGLLWTLMLLAEIDLKMFLLPDILTVPLLICGFVFVSSFHPYIAPFESSAAALAGYVIPVIASLLMLRRSKEAFGGGDIKLLSAVGAWLGMEGMLYALLLSCLFFGVYSLVRRQRAGAFGPALAAAAVVVLFFIF